MTPQSSAPISDKSRKEILYVLPDKMGGVASVVDLLCRFIPRDEFVSKTLLTRNECDSDTRVPQTLSGESNGVMTFSPTENVCSVFRRLRKQVGKSDGVLVANDWMELGAASYCDLGKRVVHFLHGDYGYYYDLADRHQQAIDRFVTHSRTICRQLQERLPGRHADIYRIPYGVDIPEMTHRRRSSKLRLIFVGRLTTGKGIGALPKIDDGLREQGIEADWTIVGDGPDAAMAVRGLEGRSAKWLGRQPNVDVRNLYRSHDVFVLPSRAEGLPVAMLEAMSAGVVPVVSSVGEVPEFLKDGFNGFCLSPNDIAGFVTAICKLERDRRRLETMGSEARETIARNYDIRLKAYEFAAFFSSCLESPRMRRGPYELSYGSRLDRPWLPNFVVRGLRSGLRMAGRRSP